MNNVPDRKHGGSRENSGRKKGSKNKNKQKKEKANTLITSWKRAADKAASTPSANSSNSSTLPIATPIALNALLKAPALQQQIVTHLETLKNNTATPISRVDDLLQAPALQQQMVTYLDKMQSTILTEVTKQVTEIITPIFTQLASVQAGTNIANIVTQLKDQQCELSKQKDALDEKYKQQQIGKLGKLKLEDCAWLALSRNLWGNIKWHCKICSLHGHLAPSENMRRQQWIDNNGGMTPGRNRLLLRHENSQLHKFSIAQERMRKQQIIPVALRDLKKANKDAMGRLFLLIAHVIKRKKSLRDSEHLTFLLDLCSADVGQKEHSRNSFRKMVMLMFDLALDDLRKVCSKRSPITGMYPHIAIGADKWSYIKRQCQIINGRLNINGAPETFNLGCTPITGKHAHDGDGVKESGGWALYNMILDACERAGVRVEVTNAELEAELAQLQQRLANISDGAVDVINITTVKSTPVVLATKKRTSSSSTSSSTSSSSSSPPPPPPLLPSPLTSKKWSDSRGTDLSKKVSAKTVQTENNTIDVDSIDFPFDNDIGEPVVRVPKTKEEKLRKKKGGKTRRLAMILLNLLTVDEENRLMECTQMIVDVIHGKAFFDIAGDGFCYYRSISGTMNLSYVLRGEAPRPRQDSISERAKPPSETNAAVRKVQDLVLDVLQTNETAAKNFKDAVVIGQTQTGTQRLDYRSNTASWKAPNNLEIRADWNPRAGWGVCLEDTMNLFRCRKEISDNALLAINDNDTDARTSRPIVFSREVRCTVALTFLQAFAMVAISRHDDETAPISPPGVRRQK